MISKKAAVNASSVSVSEHIKLTVNITGWRWFQIRLWIAALLVRLACQISGLGFETERDDEIEP